MKCLLGWIEILAQAETKNRERKKSEPGDRPESETGSESAGEKPDSPDRA
jgi:hypothetical protein